MKAAAIRHLGRSAQGGFVLGFTLSVLVILHTSARFVQAQLTATAPAAVPAPKSPFDGTPVADLKITGLSLIDESYVRNRIRTRSGEAYSEEQLQKDVSRLLQTTRFLDVKAEPILADGKISITFKLTEKPEIAAIEFVGNKKIKTKDLLEAITFGPNDPLDLYDIRQGQDAILRLYHEKGYAYTEVTFDEDLLKNEHRVVYTITENQRIKIRKIRFEGNVTYSDGELRHQMATKSYIPIFRTGDFDPERAERDVATVQQYYRERGFLDAEVGYSTTFQDVARERLELIYRVNEGIRYKVRELRFKGHSVFGDSELLAGLRLKPNEDFIDALLKADVKDLENKYGSQGYIDVTVTPSWVFATEPGQVVVTFNIHEGEQFRVGWIEVNGNARTKEKCVRRELGMYPEEIYDVTKAREAEKNLKGTGLFTEATVEPVAVEDSTPGLRDALVTVEENQKTNQFIAGVGASSDSGLLGNIMLENSNFDLSDRPRSFDEFIRGKAFRGAGQTARIQLEPGTELNRCRIDFREPYLMDQPIGLNTSAYLFERERDGYDEQRVGGIVGFDRRFEGWLKGWTGEIAFRGEGVNVDDRDSFAAEDIRDVEGWSYLSSIKLSMVHNTTDSRFDPSRGHLFRASWEQAGAMGGDYFFSNVSGSYTQHWTIAIDDQDRKSVISNATRVGQILGDAPVFERYYAGGIGSMRGFDYRGISPRQGLRHNRVGGDFMMLNTTEYSFPLYAKVIRGVFFSDMGTVEEDFGITTWRMAIGAGVRLTLDIFGTVPMEFDVALPVSKDGEDDTRWFSFFIGLPFL